MYMLLKAGAEDRTRYLSRWGDFGMPIGPWSVFLGVYPTTGMPQLKYGGKQSLCDFLWLEVAAEIANGSVGQQCEFCGSLFNSGPGTGRRADAKFCSDAHRVAFNRRERKKKEQS